MSDSVAPPVINIVDASGYLFRAYYGLPPMTAPDGAPVNAIYGLCQMLGKLGKQSSGQYLVVALDAAGKGFRHDIYPQYKANRSAPPDDLIPQFSLMREALQAFDLHALELDGYEADDIIATVTHAAVRDGVHVRIISSDKDMMQLVCDGQVEMWDPMKNRLIDAQAVYEKFHVTPDKVVDVQALAGDSSDNIPGVPKIGPKTAAELINHFGDLETLLASSAQIKQQKRRENLEEFADLARISKQLVTLNTQAPLTVSWRELQYQAPDPEKLTEFFTRMGFRSLQRRMHEFLSDQASEMATAKTMVDAVQPEYRLITTIADLQDFIAEAIKAAVVGFDVETDGLGQQATWVGFSLALPDRRAVYVPLQHRSEGLGLEILDNQCPLDEAIGLLSALLADPGVLKVGQNIKFDAHIVAQHGLSIAPIDDTLLMSFVLEAGRHGARSHALDALAERHLGHKMIAYADVVEKGKNFAMLTPEQAKNYAAEDADITLCLWSYLRESLRQQGLLQVYETLERPLSAILLLMEQRGILLDCVQLQTLGQELQTQLVALASQIYAHCGREFNIASPRQIGEILFDDLQLPGGKKTATGQYATDHAVLDTLREAHPVVSLLITWRELAKLQSTYVEGLIQAIRQDTGRIHTTYVMTGAQTGRLSSRDPNLQNIPIRSDMGAKIRRCFIAPQERVFLSMDYSQIELRLLAEMAEIESLQDAFAQNQDIHAMTASAMFGMPIDAVNAEYRRRAKAINFGIIYGISAFGLANQLGISRSEAKDFIAEYFVQFPGIRTYMDQQITQARRQGFVETLFARRVYLPDINARQANRRQHAERQAINAPLQGTAADIIKRAMIKLARSSHVQSGAVTMLLQIHDELVFEADADVDETVIDDLRLLMEQAATPAYTNKVYLKVEVERSLHL